jgi:iron complex outermembrane receptor protein
MTILAVLVPHLVLAQSSPGTAALKNLSLEELAKVEITTASKQPERAMDIAAAIYVITGEDIRRSGATTLPDALRLAPGVIVNQSDGNRWAVGVRGFADIFSKSVLVLIDGRSVYTPLVGGVHWAIQDVVLADIERIEVVRGPGGSVWGANAVNGVINVITKPAHVTRGLQVTAAAGTTERARVAARFAGDVWGASYRVYGKAFRRGAQFHADGAEFDTWHAGQLGFRSDWKSRDLDAFTLSGDLYRTEVGERAQVSLFDPPSISDVDGKLDLVGGNVRAAWQRTLPRGLRSTLQVYYDRTDRKGFTFEEARNTWDIDFNLRGAPGGRHRLSGGVNARVSPSTFTQVVPSLNFTPARHTARIFNASVADDVVILPGRLAANVGLKLEYNNYTGVEWLPSVDARWTPRPHSSFWAAFTRAVRSPSRFERDLQFRVLIDPVTPVYVSVVGSADFKTESVLGTEAGYRQLLGSDFYVDIVAFQNRHEDLQGFGTQSVALESDPIPHIAVSLPFANAFDGRSRGIEATADWKPFVNWRLSASYSHLRLTLAAKPGFTDPAMTLPNYLGASPRHQWRAQSRIDIGRGVQFDQTYRYVSSLSAGPVPGYHALDGRVGWAATPSISLSLVGQNLTDDIHPELRAVPVEIRRSAYVQLTLTR